MRTLGTLALAVALAGSRSRHPPAAPPGAPPRRRWRPLAAAAPAGAVIGSRVIGRSVRGRPIRAFHLGEPGTTRVVLVSAMHGNEAAPRQILRALEDGGPIPGSTCGWSRRTTPTAWRAAPARTRTAST